MEITNRIIEERISFSDKKLINVKEEINKIKDLKLLNETCIYVTGSYARKEATTKSDLDLFFISKMDNPISKLNKTLVDAELIRMNERLGFPAFSNDGEYLKIHSLNEIKQIGSQDEDSKNFFTARMLLLLESKPLYNDKVYDEVINDVIDSYLRDFHDHETEFKPIFLVNDILRYWKTLCLNYEHKRNRMVEDDATTEEIKSVKLKAHKKNLKLQFSRKYTCFSFIMALISDYVNKDVSINHESIKEIIKKTPTEIFVELHRVEKIRKEISEALEIYSYFLNLSEYEDDWLEKLENRNEAFAKSRKFGECMYSIIIKLIDSDKADLLRYIVL